MKIGDLGIAKPTTDTLLRTAIGTHGYMAPELVGNNVGGLGVEFGPEVDIYALGVLFWELFSGQSVEKFQQQNIKNRAGFFPTSKVKQVVKVSHQSLSPNISKLIERCCSIIPSKRPSAKEVLEILTSLQPASPTGKESKPVRSSGERPAKPLSLSNMLFNSHMPAVQYDWCYQVESTKTWTPFSHVAANSIESYFQQFATTNSPIIISINNKNYSINFYALTYQVNPFSSFPAPFPAIFQHFFPSFIPSLRTPS